MYSSIIQAPQDTPNSNRNWLQAKTKQRIASPNFKGRWQVEEELYQGSLYIVHRAKEGYVLKENQEGNGSYCALRTSVLILNRMNELAIPHVPKVLEEEFTATKAMIVQPNYGIPLSILYTKKLCPPDEAFQIMYKMIETLVALENNHWVHKALDPTNITFCPISLSVTLTGGWSDAALLLNEQTMGILSFIQETNSNTPPSQYLEDCHIDVMGLGSTLFKIITGEDLFFAPQANDSNFDSAIIHHQLYKRFGEECVRRYVKHEPLPLHNFNEVLQDRIENILPCEVSFEKAKEKILEMYPKHFQDHMNSLYNRITSLILKMIRINPAERPFATVLSEEINSFKKKQNSTGDDGGCCLIS